MRIAMIGTRGVGSNYGGIERCLDELCPRLVAMGHQVDVYSEALTQGPLPEGLRSISLPSVGGKHFANLSCSALATLRAVGHYDVIHFHATGPGILSFIARLTGQPSVATIHALDQQREKWGVLARHALSLAEKTVMLFANEVTVVSETLRRYMRERYDKLAYCVPNGLATKAAEPAGALLERHGLEPRGYLFFASRLTPEKGCHDLIKAFNRTRSPLKLAIAGAPGSAQEYYEQLQSLADPSRTVFLGLLQGDELAQAFSNAHTFVLPSYIEGMSIALLEAIAYRLPLIVSDIPENFAVVGEVPGLFPVGDLDALAEAIEACTEQPADAPVRTANGNRVPSWDTVASHYDAIYGSVAATARSQPRAVSA
jgi:glycosyltransferase involved in cell wall biosynthesis